MFTLWIKSVATATKKTKMHCLSVKFLLSTLFNLLLLIKLQKSASVRSPYWKLENVRNSKYWQKLEKLLKKIGNSAIFTTLYSDSRNHACICLGHESIAWFGASFCLFWFRFTFVLSFTNGKTRDFIFYKFILQVV